MTDSQKTAVIFGLANKRSIAWAIAQKLHQAGWRLAITYQNERLELEATDLIAEMPGAAGFMCDGPLPGERPWAEGRPRQRYFRGAHQNAGGAGNLKLRRHAQNPIGARPAETQHRCRRSRRDRYISAFGSWLRHYWRDHLRRLRLQHHGILSRTGTLACARFARDSK